MRQVPEVLGSGTTDSAEDPGEHSRFTAGNFRPVGAGQEVVCSDAIEEQSEEIEREREGSSMNADDLANTGVEVREVEE